MKNKKIIIFIILILCIIAAFYSMSGVLTPYVSFKSAIKSGDYVQVIGKLNMEKPVKHEVGYFTFDLNDEDGTLLNIMYKGTKPLNFEQADQIVVQGVFNHKNSIFEAKKILVKCPSKYKKIN